MAGLSIMSRQSLPPVPIITTYAELCRAIARQRQERGYSQIDLEARVNLAEGHIAKIEAGHRRLTSTTLDWILEALDCALVLVPVRKSAPPPPASARPLPGQMPLPLDPVPHRVELTVMQELARRGSRRTSRRKDK